MGNCSGLCHKNITTSSHSELFVPQFDINDVKGNSKTILKLHSFKKLNVGDNLKKRNSKVTTEQIIKSKTIGGQLSQTLAINSSKEILNNIQGKKEKFSFDENIKNIQQTYIPLKNIFLNTKTTLIPNCINNNNININNINNNNNNNNNNSNEIKKKDTFSKFRTLQKCDSSKMEQFESMQNLNIKYEIKEQELSKDEELLLISNLLSHYFFHRISKEILTFLIKEIKVFQIEENSTIFFEGDEGSCLFIIRSGEIKLTSEKGNKILILKDGNIFGELAILKERIIRTYTAIALTNISFYFLDETSFNIVKDNFIYNIQSDFELFLNLEKNVKENLEYLTVQIEVKKGNVISQLNCLFEIINGEFIIYDKQNKEIDKYKNGEIYNVKNFFTEFHNENNVYYQLIQNDFEHKIIANEDCLCNIFYVNSLIEVFGIEFKYKILYYFFKGTLIKDQFFSNIIPKECINSVFSQFKIEEYKRGTKLSKDKIIIIISGIAIANMFQCKNIIFKNRDIIGKYLFLNEKVEDIIVNTNHLITLECFYNHFKEAIFIKNLSMKKWILKMLEFNLFYRIKEYNLYEIANYFESNIYQKNDKILNLGEINQYVYFMSTGCVKLIIDGKTFKKYYKGSSFGEIYLLDEKESKVEFICTEKNSRIYKINKHNFYLLMQDSHLNHRIKNKICLEDVEIFPNNLYHIQILYKGKKSSIHLVHNKIYIYAMKAVYVNEMINNNNLIQNLINEKKASKSLDNNFIVKYVKTFKINSWVFFIEEYIKGITLRDYIEMINQFNDLILIKFYSSILFLILDSLKQYGIIHRDIKPENIIIDEKGYLKLIDFSSSKKIKENYTKTIIGTPMFISPEILLGKGYSYSCDYWSVGILLYYLFYGKYPFGNNTQDIDCLYKEILNKKIKIPFSNVDNGIFSNFLEKLLTKDIQFRYCSFKQISQDQFFKDFNFDDVKYKKIKPSFIPQVVKISKKKMLKNLSTPFINFIQNDNFEEDNLDAYYQDSISLDKDVIIENNENLTPKFPKNWLEDF